MARPAFRLSISRKDGKDITFTDYRGESVSKKYCPIGALFPSKIEGGFSLVLERKVTLDPDVVWVNVYPNDRDGESSGDKAPAKRPANRRARVDLDDGELPD